MCSRPSSQSVFETLTNHVRIKYVKRNDFKNDHFSNDLLKAATLGYVLRYTPVKTSDENSKLRENILIDDQISKYMAKLWQDIDLRDSITIENVTIEILGNTDDEKKTNDEEVDEKTANVTQFLLAPSDFLRQFKFSTDSSDLSKHLLRHFLLRLASNGYLNSVKLIPETETQNIDDMNSTLAVGQVIPSWSSAVIGLQEPKELKSDEESFDIMIEFYNFVNEFRNLKNKAPRIDFSSSDQPEVTSSWTGMTVSDLNECSDIETVSLLQSVPICSQFTNHSTCINTIGSFKCLAGDDIENDIVNGLGEKENIGNEESEKGKIDESESSGGMSRGNVALTTVAVVLAVGLIVLIVGYCIYRRKYQTIYQLKKDRRSQQQLTGAASGSRNIQNRPRQGRR